MTDTSCAYTGNRDDVLIAYLYDDIDPVVRETFDAHLAACGRCRADLADLRGVRAELAQWAPPDAPFVVASRLSQVVSPATSHQPPAATWWRDIPAWAQVAAALLFLGVSAGLANLDVRYNADGLTVRTGWSKPAPVAPVGPVGHVAQDVSLAKSAAAPWRGDLTALEQQLRTEFRAASLASAPAPADLIRRIHALEEGSKQQQREFSLQLAAALRDVNTQRRADLVRIDQNLGLIQNNTGIEVAKNREMLNYVLRVSSQK